MPTTGALESFEIFTQQLDQDFTSLLHSHIKHGNNTQNILNSTMVTSQNPLNLRNMMHSTQTNNITSHKAHIYEHSEEINYNHTDWINKLAIQALFAIDNFRLNFSQVSCNSLSPEMETNRVEIENDISSSCSDMGTSVNAYNGSQDGSFFHLPVVANGDDGNNPNDTFNNQCFLPAPLDVLSSTRMSDLYGDECKQNNMQHKENIYDEINEAQMLRVTKFLSVDNVDTKNNDKVGNVLLMNSGSVCNCTNSRNSEIHKAECNLNKRMIMRHNANTQLMMIHENESKKQSCKIATATPAQRNKRAVRKQYPKTPVPKSINQLHKISKTTSPREKFTLVEHEQSLRSDSTSFMHKPLCSVGVTLTSQGNTEKTTSRCSNMTRQKRGSLVQKLKKIGRSIQARCLPDNGDFKTLAFV